MRWPPKRWRGWRTLSPRHVMRTSVAHPSTSHELAPASQTSVVGTATCERWTNAAAATPAATSAAAVKRVKEDPLA